MDTHDPRDAGRTDDPEALKQRLPAAPGPYLEGAAQVAPVTPVGPMGPSVPVAPVSPVGPCTPVAPVCPVTPVAPVIPVGNLALMGDGSNNDLPMLDSVTSFACTYYGLPWPPLEPRPPLGTASCLFNADGTSRLAPLPASGAAWVELPLTSISNGPYCGSGTMGYDADLLRIRRVVVRMRVGAPAAAGGQETSELHALAGEREVVVDVVLCC